MFDTRLRLLVRLSDFGQAEHQLIVYFTRTNWIYCGVPFAAAAC